jgi:hypothetical protein
MGWRRPRRPSWRRVGCRGGGRTGCASAMRAEGRGCAAVAVVTLLGKALAAALCLRALVVRLMLSVRGQLEAGCGSAATSVRKLHCTVQRKQISPTAQTDYTSVKMPLRRSAPPGCAGYGVERRRPLISAPAKPPASRVDCVRLAPSSVCGAARAGYAVLADAL